MSCNVYKVFYKSRFRPSEGTRHRFVSALSKPHIRAVWNHMMQTDEFIIIKIEQVMK